MKFNMDKFLKGFGEGTKKEIIKKIIKVGAIRTGNLKNSIAYNVKKTGSDYVIEFSMIDYGHYVDEGSRYIIEPREFFNKVIEDHIDKVFDEVMDAALEKELEKIFRD
jgi:hypothetical protein